MINFKKLSFKNVLANGKKTTTFTFNNGETTLIVGDNGSGKSQFYEALFFALYGKAFRKIKKSQLVNTINGSNLLTEVEFNNGKNNIRVVRGILPNIFEIYIDGKRQELEASVRDQQQYFESSLLQISESTFRQIVILGSTSYVPFMLLPVGGRRVVIEELLDIGIFSTMLQISKQEFNILKRDLKEKERNVLDLKVSLDKKRKTYEELSKTVQEEVSVIDDQFAAIEEKIKKLEKEKSFKSDEISQIDYEDLLQKQKETGERQNKLIGVEAKYLAKVKQLNRDIRFFKNNDFCNVCHQDIDSEFKSKMTKNLDDKFKEVESKKVTLDTISNDLKETLDNIMKSFESHKKLANEIRSISNKITIHKKEIDSLNDKLSLVKEGSSSQALDSISSDIEQTTNKLGDFKRQGKSLLTKVKNYDVFIELLKDTGIKAKIIESHLPIINQFIQRYMDILEFPLSFTFDNEFNEIIKSRGRDELSYGNFSAGEKLRIDLCLLFTWRELTRVRNSAYCNLIILDEIGDSSLDGTGLAGFNKILKSGGQNQCAIIISHNAENMKGIDKTVRVEKVGNFSNYEFLEE